MYAPPRRSEIFEKTYINTISQILTYGDPFNGATVKGFDQSKIKINCNPTDGVCKGDFSIGIGHLSYSTGSGVSWLKALEKAG